MNHISYEEWWNLLFRCKVMEPRAVELGYKYKIPIYVAKTLSDDKEH